MASGNRITTTGILYINGAQVENTFTNISKITKKLESELRKLPVGTEAWRKKAEELRTARERFNEVRDEIKAIGQELEDTGFSISGFIGKLFNFGEVFSSVFSANIASDFFNGFISKAGETVEKLLEIEDAMTDVSKTSGMTHDQVKELWDEFDQMDTRTNKLDRLKIAEVAGRLGVPIAQMKDFVQEVDKAYVALGDSFEGGLEGVVDQLGKIKGLFDTTKEMSYAEAINRVGSALNTLAAQGTASEGNIAQFALRLGTLPDALKPAIDKVLGLGAAFEESGIDSQIASSGFSNFITTAASNIDAFAYSMNMSVAEATKLINTKPEEFFLRFAAGMKGLSADKTAKVLESLKLNSLEVQKAVGAAANKTDDFRRAMNTAGEEMDKMNSLTNEFNQKNNNAPAIIEKLKNAWNDMFTSTNILNRFEWLIQLIGNITGVTSAAGDGVVIFKERLSFLLKLMIILTTSTLSYNAAVWLLTLTTKAGWQQTIIYNAIQKLKVYWETLARNTSLLYAAAQALVAGNTLRAAAAMRVFNASASANPIGLLVALVTAAATAYMLFSKNVDTAAKKQRTLSEAQKAMNEQVKKDTEDIRSKINPLIKILNDQNKTLAERRAAYEALIKIAPEFKGTVDKEYFATLKLGEAYGKLIDKITNLAKKKALETLTSDKQTALIQEEAKIDSLQAEKEENTYQLTGVMPGGKEWIVDEQRKKISKAEQSRLIERNKAIDIQLSDARKKIDNYQKEINGLNNTIETRYGDLFEEKKQEESGPLNREAPKKEKKDKEAEKAQNDLEKARAAYNKSIEDYNASLKKILEANQGFEDEKLKIIEESKLKDISAESLEYERKLAALKQSNTEIEAEIKKSQDLIKNLERDKSETKSPEAKEVFQKAIDKEKQTIAERRKLVSVNDNIEKQLLSTHLYNVAKIHEKWNTAIYQKYLEDQQRFIDLQRQQDEEEIININSLSEAKSKLKDNEYLKLTDQELRNIKTLEDAKAALREAADRKMLQAQLVTLEASKSQLENLIKSISDGPAKEALLKNLNELSLKITEIKSSIKGGNEQDAAKKVKEQEEAKENVDILGFSAKDWEDTFSNLDSLSDKLKATAMVFQALGNAANMYAELQNALGQKELKKFEAVQDKKKKALDKKLKEGWITQEDYNKQVEKLEVETANKKAEIEYKQAKAEKTAKIISAIGATALGVANSLATGGPAGIALAAIVGALGAIQIGIIAAQPLPEKPQYSMASGGYFEGYTGESDLPEDETGERPVGNVKLHRKEWVAPRWMTESPRLANVFGYLESVRTGREKPMADGGFVDNATSSVASNTQANPVDNSGDWLPVITDVRDFLKKLYEEGVIAVLGENAKNAKKMKKMIKNIDELENKNKH